MQRDIQNIEDDISLTKRIIETVLCGDSDVVEVLDNPSIDPDSPEDLLYQNLYPFIRIPGTQDTARNYICYSIDDMSGENRNDRIKQQLIQFVAFVHKDLVKTKYGVARHDMLGYLIRDLFNRSHLFGHELKMIYNKEGVTDTDYTTRTLKFQLITSEVQQDGLFDNRYERFSLNAHDKRLVRENVRNR